MDSTWKLVATLGTHCGTHHDVLCAWLAPDGSFAWLFDDRGWLRRMDLRAWTERAWSLFEQQNIDESYDFTAQFAGVDEPFLWLTYGTTESRTVAVFALSERGAALRKTITDAQPASDGPTGSGAAQTAVIVRETQPPQRAHIFAPDGTPLGVRPSETIAASIQGYWTQRDDRFEFFTHDEKYLGGATLPTDDLWTVFGVADDDRLVLASGSRYAGVHEAELALVDAERSQCQRMKATPFLVRDPYYFYGGSQRWRALVHRTGVVCTIQQPRAAPSALYGLHRWDSPQATPLPFDFAAVLHWLDDRWVLATTSGHCALYEIATEQLTESHCPPVQSIALGDRNQPLVVQHKGGLTRWWDVERESVVAEDRSRAVFHRELVGLRCGGTRAVFTESPTVGSVTVVERAVSDGLARETWSATLEHAGDPVYVTALGDDHAIVQRSSTQPMVSKFVLLSRGSDAHTQLGDGDYPSGRLRVDGDALVLERYGVKQGLNHAFQRVRIAPDGSRSVLEERALESISNVSASSEAGCVSVIEARSIVRFATRDGVTTDHPCATGSKGAAIATALLRAVVHADDGQSVCVVDAKDGVIARWRVIEAGNITALAISPDGGTVAVGSSDGRVLVYREP